jgi:phage major head subunit gpT-like protein
MSLMGVQGSASSVEYSQGVGSFGLIPEYNSAEAEKNGSVILYDSFSPLFEKTFTHKEYAKGVAIERKLVDDNQTGQILRKAQNLGHSFGTTRAYHASSVLNNAFSGVLGGDGKVLCATDHPRNTVDATSVSNAGTTALSYAAMVNTLIEIGRAHV